jgi:L-fuculose-phosphate aldolase
MNQIKEALINFGGRMYERGFIVATEGNLSCRLNSDHILATRSGICKGEMSEGDLITLDLQGNVTESKLQPSAEILMHLEVYRQREDIKAVIHAHPPYILALALAGISLESPYLPESVILLGAVPIAPYARPSTARVPDSIRKYVTKTDIIVLYRHGSLTMGRNLQEAYHKLEILEQTAKIIWLATQVGTLEKLPPEEVEEILALRKKTYGLDHPILPFE